MVDDGSCTVNRERTALSEILSDRVIAFQPRLARVLGGVAEAILLQQVMFWGRQTDDGWVFRTQTQIEAETTLSADVQQRARSVLVGLGVLHEERRRGNRLHYRADVHRLIELLGEAAMSDAVASTSTGTSPLGGPPSPLHPLSPPISPPEKNLPPSSPPAKLSTLPKRAMAIQDDFAPTERTLELVLNYEHITVDDIDGEVRRFVNWHQSKGTTYKDWQAAFRTWMTNLSERRKELVSQRPTGPVFREMPKLSLVASNDKPETTGAVVGSDGRRRSAEYAARIARRNGGGS